MDIKIKNGKEYIFDIVRKKYIRKQPEELVRQNMIQYLSQKKGYPISLMSIEKETNLSDLKKRCDIVCYDKNGEPLLLVECKANTINLNSEVFNQTITYQKKIEAKYILITNGENHYCFTLKNKKINFLKRIPTYGEIIKINP